MLGEQPFRDHVFRVTPDVLIPRPDTEVLVARALETIPLERATRVLDLGTGSGCIAISIALERPDCEVVAVDASPAALAVARDNAARLGAGNVALPGVGLVCGARAANASTSSCRIRPTSRRAIRTWPT